jgi:hypothetical protein
VPFFLALNNGNAMRLHLVEQLMGRPAEPADISGGFLVLNNHLCLIAGHIHDVPTLQTKKNKNRPAGGDLDTATGWDCIRHICGFPVPFP